MTDVMTLYSTSDADYLPAIYFIYIPEFNCYKDQSLMDIVKFCFADHFLPQVHINNKWNLELS